MKFTSILLLTLLHLLHGPVRAGINDCRGLWLFDNGLQPYWSCQPPLVETGYSTGIWPTELFANPPSISVNKPVYPLPALTPAQRLRMVNWAPPNGGPGATRTNRWTLIMDLKITNPGAGTAWYSLLQTNPANTDDGDLFVRQDGLIFAGVSLAPAGTVGSGWHRLAVTCDNNGAGGNLTLQAYLDGSPVGTAITRTYEGAQSIPADASLFADDNNETGGLRIKAVAFWSEALTPAQILAMGGTKADLTWTGRPAQTACPGLTGDLFFSYYHTTLPYGPWHMDLDAAGKVAVNITTPIALDGFPNHRFSGVIPVTVNPDGTLNYAGTGSVPVNYSAAFFDDFYHGGIRTRRNGLTLTATGLRASEFILYFPDGMGASWWLGTDTEPDRRMKSRVNRANLQLNAALQPWVSFSILPTDLDSVANNTTDRIGLHIERLPVFFKCSSIFWNSTAGLLQPQGAVPKFVRQQSRDELLAFNGQVRPSNDDYFNWVDAVTGTFSINAVSGWVQLKELHLRLELGGAGALPIFAPHFPLGSAVSWTGGAFMNFTDGEVTLSSSTGAGTGSVTFRRDCDVPGCSSVTPPADKTMNMTAATWDFGRDGGMAAPVTIPSATVNGIENQRTVEWGGSNATTFAHRISTLVTSGRFRMPGNVLTAARAGSVSYENRPAALLLAGLGQPGNASYPEMPGSAAYYTGEADYAGLNFQAASNGALAATSRFGNASVGPYDLRTTSKYYLRASGIAGRHEAVADPNPPPGTPFPIITSIYGFPFRLTSVRMSFMDGQNWDSAINGELDIPAPAQITALGFKNLRFGCRGELLSATLKNNTPFRLGYWNCDITPYALNFGVPSDPCAAGTSGCVVIGCEADWPALSDQPFSGSIGFKSNGHTVTPADAYQVEKVTINSRLKGPAQLRVKGPGTKTYPFLPLSQGAYLNEYTGTAPQPGFVTIAGEVDVPFFKSMPVVLHAQSSALAVPGSQMFVLQGDSANFNFFTTGEPDPGNLGYPSSSSLAAFRTTQPRARRTWLDVVNFDLPVAWTDATRLFSSTDAVRDNLLVFNLDRRVQTMSPDVADLRVGVKVNGLPSVSAGSLLDDLGVGPSSLLNAIRGTSVGTRMDEALAGIRALDDLLADVPEALLGPALDAAVLSAAGTGGSSLYTQLQNEYQTNGKTGYLANGPALISARTGAIGGNITNLLSGTGAWITTIKAKITAAKNAAAKLKEIADTAAAFKALAGAIAGSNPSDEQTDTADDILGALSVTMAELITRLTALETELNAGGTIQQSLSGVFTGTSFVNGALSSLSADWITGLVNDHLDVSVTDPLGDFWSYNKENEFNSALQKKVREAFFGSGVSASLRTQMQLAFADAAFGLRGGFDGILSASNEVVQAVANISPPEDPVDALGGQITKVFKGAKLQGAAKIAGDSLKELRIDGDIQIAVPDDMRMRAWLIMRDVDSSMPGGACLAAGGMKTEVTVGAATKLTWLSQPTELEAQLKLGVGTTGPVSLAGDLGFKGRITMGAVTLNEARFGAGFGANQAYIMAKGAGQIETPNFAMAAQAGIFAGRTCELSAVKQINPNVEAVLTNSAINMGAPSNASPITGFYSMGSGQLSVLTLIGIPATCLLDLRLGGGQGTFYFIQGGPEIKPNGSLGFVAGSKLVVGMEQSMSINGEVLCLVNVGGSLGGVIATGLALPESMSAISFDNLRAAGRLTATVNGEIGVCPFCYDFSKTLYVDLSVDPTASPKVKWDVKY